MSPDELKIYFSQLTKNQPANNFFTLQHVINIVIKISITLSDEIQISFIGKRNNKNKCFALEINVFNTITE